MKRKLRINSMHDKPGMVNNRYKVNDVHLSTSVITKIYHVQSSWDLA